MNDEREGEQYEGVVAVQLDALGDERVRVRRQHVWIVPADVVPSRVVRQKKTRWGWSAAKA